MKIASKSLAWLILALLLSSSSAFAAPPISVSTNTCLFVDDYFIAEQSGFKRTLHQGKPHPQAILAETEPWDHWIALNGACFYDPVGKVYRMYYTSTHYPSGEPGISFRQDTCYAESKDAIHWTKPKLGLVDFKGSKDNNILFYVASPGNVFIDPKATDPKARLKGFIYFTKTDPTYNNARTFTFLQSADGLHWEYLDVLGAPTFARAGDGPFVDGMQHGGWDPLKNRYVAEVRTFPIYKFADKPSGKRRAIGISWSDKINQDWTPAVQILQPDDRDDARAALLSKDPEKPDFTEFYEMVPFAYGNHYIGFMTIHEFADSKDCNGGGGLQFTFSNDGLHWTRPEFGDGPEAVKKPRLNAIENSTDSELHPNFAQYNPPLDMGDEIWLYYSENNGTHGEMPWDKSHGRIRAAVWRMDGFASLDAAGTATLITKPLAHAGKELVVNFQTEEGGSVLVGLQDESGLPIAQFALGECLPLKGNATAQKVEWTGGADFSKRVGDKPVRLMFELNKARLWSFRFEPGKLPRVLIIGDSISQSDTFGYTAPTTEALRGQAIVVHQPGNAMDTRNGLKMLTSWLGDEPYDVIHFNWGLHDIKDQGRFIPLDEYEKNLRELLGRLQETKAKLIWASTTPVPEGAGKGRRNSEVVAYNAVAKKIMDEHGIPIDDLYAFALPQLDQLQSPRDVHFTEKGSKVLAGKVADSIRAALGIRPVGSAATP